MRLRGEEREFALSEGPRSHKTPHDCENHASLELRLVEKRDDPETHPVPFLHPCIDQGRCRLLRVNTKSWTVLIVTCPSRAAFTDRPKPKFSLHPSLQNGGAGAAGILTT